MWPSPTPPASRSASWPMNPCGRRPAAEEEKLGGQGRILIRPSGTEALIRVMVEAKTTEIAHQVASVLADFIKKL